MTAVRHAVGDRRLGSVVRLLLTAGVLVALLPIAGGLNPSVAHAAPALSMTQEIAAQTLIGRDTPVDLTIENTGPDPAYDIAIVVRLPVGVSVIASDFPATQTIVETDTNGEPTGTVVAWENLVDIRPNGLFHFGYTLSHDVGTDPGQWSVNETIDAPAEVYTNEVDNVIPSVDPNGTTDPVMAVVSNYTQTATAPGSTLLVPVLVTKSEPSVESELPRGVHDQQTTYTIQLETGDAGGVGVTTIDDWLPAGLEFLGCGTGDNSLTEEYPGAGPLNPGNAPALPNPCPEAQIASVETVDSPAGIGSGVYTHVVWDFTGSTLPPNDVIAFSYVAGIPQRENTLTWPSGEPDPASGDQASNLDNNTGASTVQNGDGIVYTNVVQANTSFLGTDSVVEAEESVQAIDVAVHKFVDLPVVEQGATSRWTLFIETSEYVADGGVSDLDLTDVAPDGLCPLDSLHPGCGTTPPPNPPYTDTSFDGGNGETTLHWDLSAEQLGPNQQLYVTFNSQTLTNYVSPPQLPVSTNDVLTNRVQLLSADVDTFGPDGPNGPLANNPVTDDSSASQAGTPVTFHKDVGAPPPDGDCGDGSTISWVDDDLAAAGPGDRACFRLTARTPNSLDAVTPTLVDFLPPGFAYVDGSTMPGADNQVPPDEVIFTTTGNANSGERLQWTLPPTTFFEPAQTAQVVFAADLIGVDGNAPDLGASGDEIRNEARFSFENSGGEIFVVPDDAGGILSEAELDLTKGIIEIDGIGVPGAPVDTAVDVTGGQAVTYALDVVNDGTRDAFGVEVRDLLAVNGDGITAEDAVCAAITGITTPTPSTAACTDGVGITWNDLEVPAGTSVRLEYTWTLPDPVSIATNWKNEAGIVEYRSLTNLTTASEFLYVPRDNIDPSREPDANTDPARDDAHLFSPGISLTKSRTTDITEPGNNGGSQATIGEIIHFTVVTRQSAGTAAENYLLSDDLTGRGLTLIPTSVNYQTSNIPPDGNCDFSGPFLTTGLTITGNLIELSGAGQLALADQDGCLGLFFSAIVEDAPDDPNEVLNVRPNSVRNEAVLTFDADVDPNVALPREVRASVNTQVVEPSLRIEKRSSASGPVLPGATIDYELVVTNQTGTQVSTAHDLSVVDDFSGSAVAAVTDTGGGTQVGDTIEWTLGPDPDGDGTPGVAPGASFTLSYTVQLEGNLIAGATLTNTATLRGTSIEGADPGERSALVGDPSACAPTDCPGYFDTDSDTLTVGGPSFAKDVARPLHTVGDLVVYQFTAEAPPNLDFGTASITDDLGGGSLSYVAAIGASCTGCSPAEEAAFVTPENNGTANSGTPRWDLGIVGPSAQTRTAIITYVARVVDDGVVADGDTITNTAILTFGNGTRTDDATIEIAEPDVGIVKRVATPASPLDVTTGGDPALGRVGDTITYELEVTNSGDWTAYGVQVADEPDSVSSGGSCTGDVRLESLDMPTQPGVTITDDTLGAGDSCIGWEIPVMLPGATFILTYDLTIPDDFPRSELITGSEFVNVASVTEYYGLVATERANNPDARQYPDTSPTAEGYVDLAGGILGDLVWFDIDGDGFGPDTPGPDTDPTEPGIPGVDVVVTWHGPDGVLGGGDDVVTTATTDADGRWTTDDGSLPPNWLATGNYTIAVDTTTLPPGLVNTFAADGTPDDTTTATLAENEENLDQDFGYTGAQTIGDLVWLDLDNDGVGPDSAGAGPEDLLEPGIPGVDVDIVWAGFDGILGTADDVPLGTATTDASGRYTMGAVPAGPVRATVDEGPLGAAGLVSTYDLDDGTTAPDGIADRLVDPGVDALDLDFGYTGQTGGDPQALGDRVWLDLDADGVQELGEPGIAGVELTAVWAGLPGGAPVTLPTVTTGAVGPDGLYLWVNIPAGDYTVTVDQATLPAGVVATYDLDSGTTAPDNTAARTIGLGETATDVDFGYNGTGSLGDFVWLDRNGDGVQDPGEPGIAGVDVTVSGGGFTFPTVTTDGAGVYTVPGLPAGDYTAVVDTASLPAGVTATFDLDGGDDSTADRTLAAGENATDVDFGYVGAVDAGDFVWLDFDADGVQDPGEPGIAGVTMTLVWAGFDGTFGTGDDAMLTTTTDGDPDVGMDNYLFTALPPGDYTVTVDVATLPPATVLTFDPDGGSDSTSTFTLSDVDNDLDQDFGYAGTASLGDFVWLDVDEDGVQDVGEPGIPGVTVDLEWAGSDGTFGTADDATLTATTDGDPDVGMDNYLFGALPLGEYRVTVDTSTLPPGLAATYDLDGGDDDTADRTLAPGEAATDVDFGYAGTAEVGDLVWLDENGDGVQGLLEPGLAAVGLAVTWAGFDGTLGTADDVAFPVATTDADGLYLAGNLPAGDVLVEVDPATIHPGLVQTFDADGTLDGATTRSLTVGQSDLDADFGYVGQFTIGDLVWLDVDGDGNGPDTAAPDTDPADPGIPGQRVVVRWAGIDDALDTADDVVFPPIQTDAGGRWTRSGIPDGDVRVTLLGAPANQLTVTADPDGTLDGTTVRTITQADDLAIDFGLRGTASVGDTVWVDFDADGVRDTGEPPLAGVDVTVVWEGFDGTLGNGDDVVFGTVATNALGRYVVGDLPAGQVRVTVDTTTLPAGLVATFDLDGGNDSTAVRDLALGENARDVDFGYRGRGRAGDFVWWDLDGDRVQDAGEPGWPAVGVQLLWAGADGQFGNGDDGGLSTTTTASGRYLFTNLPPGLYRVTVDRTDLPAGLTPTADPDGGGDSMAAFTLANAATNLQQDFGYVGARTLGDLVWLDTNLDGDRQASETAIGGAALTIVYAGADGAAGGGDDVTLRTRTSTAPTTTSPLTLSAFGGTPAAGEPFYRVRGLPPGSYIVRLDPASLPANTTPSSDRDGGNAAVTTVRIAGTNIVDADFAVFRNSAPVPPPTGAVSSTCGSTVEVDPTAGVSDPNGDPVTLVPGSVVAPPGVQVVVTSSGNLRITPGPTISDDFTVSWTVQDGRGGTAPDAVRVTVSCNDLPSTGADPIRWIGIATIIIAVGGVMLIGSRRRTRRAG